jgi:hypothetical protein
VRGKRSREKTGSDPPHREPEGIQCCGLSTANNAFFRFPGLLRSLTHRTASPQITFGNCKTDEPSRKYLSWYPPRPYYRLSLGTHQFRHLLGSTPLPQTLSQTHHQPSLGTHHSSFCLPTPPSLNLRPFSTNLSLGIPHITTSLKALGRLSEGSLKAL